MKTSDFRNKKFLDKYNKRAISSEFIGIPAILKLLKNIKGKNILDLGCGPGFLIKTLYKRGARIFAVDNSKEIIKICKEKNININNLKCFVGDATNLNFFSNNKFDVVIMHMVFLNIPSKNKIEKIFKEVSRVLKKSGVLIFSDLHPVVKMLGGAGTEKKITKLPGFSYFRDGSKYKANVLLGDYSRIEFLDSHWKLETYSKFLNKNKMVIEEIIEPKPIRLDPKKILKNYKIPEYIIFKCRKI